MQLALLEDVDAFLSLGEELNHAFSGRYADYFDPALWGTTPHDFLLRVREQVKRALKESE